jgi:alpha-galactosidase
VNRKAAVRIDGPAELGVRPGTPFLYRVRATGTRPMRFSGDMPPGLSLDAEDGLIEGVITEPGEHAVSVRVANEAGDAEWSARIVAGDRLALTPPMGWMSWNAFGRDLDEAAVLGNADAIVRSGLRDVGYEYVCLDDHWHGGRDRDGRLRPDPVRFPRGIGPVVDDVHRLGLKLGIYTCAGTLTCGGEAGSEGFEELDAATFAEWGVDYVKDDYCHAPPEREAAIERYARMGSALAATGRSIVFAVCEWGGRAPWEWAPSVGASLWRTTGDVRDTWSGGGGIITLADATEPLAAWASPGGWNDPDMLVAGLRGRSRPGAAGTLGCSDAEYRSQVSLWAMLAAPLLASCDLRDADAETIVALGTPGVLAIDQDPLGRPGRRIRSLDQVDVWERELAGGASAAAVVNRAGVAVSVRLAWQADHGAPPDVVDAWTDEPVRAGAPETRLAAHETLLYRVGSPRGGERLAVDVVG